MKTFSIEYKIIALLLALAFMFQSMESINEHTYFIGINSYHIDNTCMMKTPTHLAIHCSNYNCNY